MPSAEFRMPNGSRTLTKTARRILLVAALLLVGAAWGLSYVRWRVGSERG